MGEGVILGGLVGWRYCWLVEILEIRIVWENNGLNLKIEFYGFGDVSFRVYGVVVYIRFINEVGEILIRFVTLKSRVVFINIMLFLRLELLVVVVNLRLFKFVVEFLFVKID